MEKHEPERSVSMRVSKHGDRDITFHFSRPVKTFVLGRTDVRRLRRALKGRLHYKLEERLT